MNTGPTPSVLLPLSVLRTKAPGTKVRFLGCIKQYQPHSSRDFPLLQLEHDFPRGNGKAVDVDVGLVLEGMKGRGDEAGRFEVGEWINVVGYLVACDKKRMDKDDEEQRALVKALVVWSAGGVKLDQYEKAIVGLKETSLDRG